MTGWRRRPTQSIENPEIRKKEGLKLEKKRRGDVKKEEIRKKIK